MRALFLTGLVAQGVPSCQYLRVALLRVANYTALVVLVANSFGVSRRFNVLLPS